MVEQNAPKTKEQFIAEMTEAAGSPEGARQIADIISESYRLVAALDQKCVDFMRMSDDMLRENNIESAREFRVLANQCSRMMSLIKTAGQGTGTDKFGL